MILFDWKCVQCEAVAEHEFPDRTVSCTEFPCAPCETMTFHVKQVGGQPKRTLKVKRHYLSNSILRQGD